MLGEEPRWSLFNLPPTPVLGVGLLIRDDRRGDSPDLTRWPGAVPAGGAVRQTSEQTLETFKLFRVTGAPSGMALPRH